MNPVEIGIITLLSIWSIIAIVIGVVAVLILWQVKKALDKINHVLHSAENMAGGVEAASKLMASGVAGLVAKGLKNPGKTITRIAAARKKT